MTEARSTITLLVQTPRGPRYQGVSVALDKPLPAWRGMMASLRLPKGAQARYRTPLRRHLGDAFEAARNRTIHWNLYHGEEALPHSYRCPLTDTRLRA